MRNQRLKGLFLKLALLLVLGSPFANAAKFDFYLGGFDFTAETNADKGSVNGVGTYKLGYYLPLFHNFEAGIGYTLIMSDTFSGDAAFGFDIEGAYYPFTSSRATEVRTDRVSAVYNPLWKPFIMMGYHARQFQSVSTQYNGFGVGIGAERVLTARYNFKSLLRYATLAGANDGKATEIVILVGLTFNL